MKKVMKMQSYAVIKAANLSKAEIDGFIEELYRRGLLRDITIVDGGKVVKHMDGLHGLWGTLPSPFNKCRGKPVSGTNRLTAADNNNFVYSCARASSGTLLH